MYFALQALSDKDFCAQSISSKPSQYEVNAIATHLYVQPNLLQPLFSAEEIVCNILWRFLQLRGYVSEKHELTAWGNLLHNILQKLDSTREQAEAALLATELLRLGLLTGNALFPKDYGGAAVHGSGITAILVDALPLLTICRNRQK